MKAVIQRVRAASVEVNGQSVSAIGKGLLIFLGVARHDTEEHCIRMARKIGGLRIFEDTSQKMNLSNENVNGEYLVVSQFTLLADLSKGKRPGFENAMKPPDSERLYTRFCTLLEEATGRPVRTGQFGATMLVTIENDGPATFVLDSTD
jgi:D-tyrosyl-tRNA(Tyr) deacylase